MRVILPEEMARIDRAAIMDAGIPGLDLMERAGEAVARAARDMLSATGGRTAVIVCGKGNNGGDGLVAARRLSGAFSVVAYLVGARSIDDLSPDAASNMRRLRDGAATVTWVPEGDAAGDMRAKVPEFDLVVDALFGTGFRGPATGIFTEAIEAMNASENQVLSVDIPSGVSGATGAIEGSAVIADRTVTFAAPKVGLTQFPGAGNVGEMEVADIGIPRELLDSIPESRIYLTTDEDADSFLPDRPPDAHKGSCGRLLVVGGSPGMTGAPVMAARAALRSGAGLVTVAAPEGLNDILETKLTEAMTMPVAEGPGRTLSESSAESILNEASSYSAVALGPGLGTAAHTRRAVERLLLELEQPLVLDADGLNAIAGAADSLRARVRPLVLTPHPGEMARLTGLSTALVQADRITVASRFSAEWGAVVVLKGAGTVIADPGGEVFVNPTGNSGMATAGMGDVLTGCIASFLAQGLEAFAAAVAGAYFHGQAGDLAAHVDGMAGMIAGDVVRHLPLAIRRVSEERWL